MATTQYINATNLKTNLKSQHDSHHQHDDGDHLDDSSRASRRSPAISNTTQITEIVSQQQHKQDGFNNDGRRRPHYASNQRSSGSQHQQFYNAQNNAPQQQQQQQVATSTSISNKYESGGGGGGNSINDYQIMMQGEGTFDIRLVQAGRKHLNRAAQLGGKQQRARNVTTASTSSALQVAASQRRIIQQQHHLIESNSTAMATGKGTMHKQQLHTDGSASAAALLSKRSHSKPTTIMKKAHSMQGYQRSMMAATTKKQPTIGQQNMLLQQSLNGMGDHQYNRPQKFNQTYSKQLLKGVSYTTKTGGLEEEISLGDGGLRDTQHLQGCETATSVMPISAQQTMLIKVNNLSNNGQDVLQNGDGAASQNNLIHSQQTRHRAQEQRIRNLQAKIQKKRNSSLLRPQTGYQIRSQHYGGSVYRNQTSAANRDLISQRVTMTHTNTSSNNPYQKAQLQVLRKNESEVLGDGRGRKQQQHQTATNDNTASTTYMSLTTNQSQGLKFQYRKKNNSQNRRRNLQNHSFMPLKEDLLSENPIVGLGAEGRQNLNQASTSSFLLSDTRGDTNTNHNANSKNLSPSNSIGNRLDRVTVGQQSTRDQQDALLSYTVQPAMSVHGQSGKQASHHRALAQKKPLVAQNRIKKPQKQQLILFTGSDQVKLEVPSSTQQVTTAATASTQLNKAVTLPIQPQAVKRRIVQKPTQTDNQAGVYSPNPHPARKWITSNNSNSRFNPKKLPVVAGGGSSNFEPGLPHHLITQQNTDLDTPPLKTHQAMRAHSSSMRSKNHSKLSTPQPQFMATAVVDDFAFEQVKSLLDQTNMHETTSLSRADDVSHKNGSDDYRNKIKQPEIKQDSQISSHCENQISVNFNEKVNESAQKREISQQRCSPPENDNSPSAHDLLQPNDDEDRQYLDLMNETSFLTQQVKDLERPVSYQLNDGNQMQADGRDQQESQRLHQSSILRHEIYSNEQQRSLSTKKKQVSIREDSKFSKSGNSARSHRDQKSYSSTHILIKNSLVPSSLTRPKHTHQHQYHQNCCGQSHSQINGDQYYLSSERKQSIGSMKSGRSGPKFIISNMKAKVPLSNAEQNALARIQQETKVLDQRLKNDHNRLARIYRAQVVGSKTPDVLHSHRSKAKSDRKVRNRPSVSKGKKERLNESMVVAQDRIECERCRNKRNNNIDQQSSASAAAAGASSNNIKGPAGAAKGIITSQVKNKKKGSSTKGGNAMMWSSHIGGADKPESTFSQHSMFCSTVKKRSFGHNSVLSRRSRSSQNSNYKKILNRKFVISRDLSKYSKELDYKKSQRKLVMFSKSAKGKHLTSMRQRAEMVSELETKWNREREALKNTDWEDSDIFNAYKESKEQRLPIAKVLQRFAELKTVTADKMYTDVELQYYMQLIQRKHCKENSKEVQEENREKIVLEFFNRSLYTLQALTKLLKIDFHYDRMFQKYEFDYSVDTVLMLMTRSRKMYHAIEMILTIIKLIEKLRQIDKSQPSQSQTLYQDNRDLNATPLSKKSSAMLLKQPINPEILKNLKARIRCHIKSFLAQHTLFPVQFKYGGIDQLTFLKTGRPDSHLSGESRIINLRLGQSSRNSMLSGRSSVVSRKSRKSSKNQDQAATKGTSVNSLTRKDKKKGKKQIRPLSRTMKQTPSKNTENQIMSSKDL